MAFNLLKKALILAPTLAHFQEDWPTKLETNAFNDIISGALF